MMISQRSLFLILSLSALLLTVTACSDSANEDKPLNRFSQEIKSDVTALKMKVNGFTTIPVTVRNSGSETWAFSGMFPVNLSDEWFLDDVHFPLEGARTRMKKDLAPGAEVHLDLNVIAPPTPGQYLLRVTMVQERVRWFLDAGAKSYDIAVTVE